MAKSTLIREKQDIARFLPELGHYKLTELRPEIFRKYYTKLRNTVSVQTGKPLSEHTVEGVHACLCGILSDAMEGGFITHNPAWRTYKYSGKKKEKKVANEYRRECKYETSSYDERELTDDDYIFRRKGAALPMTPSSFTWRFKLILRKHGLPESLNVHSLRHTNASLLIAGGTDVTTVAGLLGPAQPSTTLDIYSHAFDKNKREASRAMQTGIEI